MNLNRGQHRPHLGAPCKSNPQAPPRPTESEPRGGPRAVLPSGRLGVPLEPEKGLLTAKYDDDGGTQTRNTERQDLRLEQVSRAALVTL